MYMLICIIAVEHIFCYIVWAGGLITNKHSIAMCGSSPWATLLIEVKFEAWSWHAWYSSLYFGRVVVAMLFPMWRSYYDYTLNN
jgi:hypothetical protein